MSCSSTFLCSTCTATTEIYTLSLHDALPISFMLAPLEVIGVDAFEENAVRLKVRIKTAPLKQWFVGREFRRRIYETFRQRDRKSTRLNSSHTVISYAVFCSKKKKSTTQQT